jgi:hypothetical protein
VTRSWSSCTRQASTSAAPGRPADDRNYLVLTLRDGQVVAMRACRDRAEAAARAGLGPP